MKSAVVTEDCVKDLPDDVSRNLATPVHFSGQSHTIRTEEGQTNEAAIQPSDTLVALEGALAETLDPIRLTAAAFTEESLTELANSIEASVEAAVASRTGDAPAIDWAWLGDTDRWENVRSAVQFGAELSDQQLDYVCLKHEHNERLMLNHQMAEAAASYATILKLNPLDRLAMVKLALCILSLRRSATSEATAASLFRSAGRSDAGNEHLRSLVQAVNRILMVDEVDLMEELQVETLSEGIIIALLQIVSTADVHRRSEPLVNEIL